MILSSLPLTQTMWGAGVPYSGTRRTAYLPNDPEGSEVRSCKAFSFAVRCVLAGIRSSE